MLELYYLVPVSSWKSCCCKTFTPARERPCTSALQLKSARGGGGGGKQPKTLSLWNCDLSCHRLLQKLKQDILIDNVLILKKVLLPLIKQVLLCKTSEFFWFFYWSVTSYLVASEHVVVQVRVLHSKPHMLCVTSTCPGGLYGRGFPNCIKQDTFTSTTGWNWDGLLAPVLWRMKKIVLSNNRRVLRQSLELKGRLHIQGETWRKNNHEKHKFHCKLIWPDFFWHYLTAVISIKLL